jgi:hypothetical protein
MPNPSGKPSPWSDRRLPGQSNAAMSGQQGGAQNIFGKTQPGDPSLRNVPALIRKHTATPPAMAPTPPQPMQSMFTGGMQNMQPALNSYDPTRETQAAVSLMQPQSNVPAQAYVNKSGYMSEEEMQQAQFDMGVHPFQQWESLPTTGAAAAMGAGIGLRSLPASNGNEAFQMSQQTQSAYDNLMNAAAEAGQVDDAAYDAMLNQGLGNITRQMDQQAYDLASQRASGGLAGRGLTQDLMLAAAETAQRSGFEADIGMAKNAEALQRELAQLQAYTSAYGIMLPADVQAQIAARSADLEQQLIDLNKQSLENEWAFMGPYQAGMYGRTFGEGLSTSDSLALWAEAGGDPQKYQQLLIEYYGG